MEEIKVGDYVRTDTKIGRVLKIKDENKFYRYVVRFKKRTTNVNEDSIKKHSPNIIDLIGVGDIVHTRDVLNEDYYWMFDEEMVQATKETIQDGIELVDILTHEQYQQNCYKV